jgi:hypothetical protein
LTLDSAVAPHFTLQQGLLRYKNMIWIGLDSTLHSELISAFHASAVGGHSGISVTYRRMKQCITWRGMKLAVKHFVKACLICQQSKPERVKYPGLLQPLPIPDSVWQVITMDFVEGLPQSGAANCIMVVVGKLTKYAHFLPLKYPYTTQSVSKVFLDSIYNLHGFPQSIVSDRDRIFTSHFWRELFSLAHV